jgi:predicted O-methyltransferase YrrM
MYDLEPWKRPTGIIENVVPTPPRPDGAEAPAAPVRDTDRVTLDLHRLDAKMTRLVIDREHCPPGSWQYNPTLLEHRGKLVACVRLYLDGNRRENVIGEIDDEGKLVNQRMLRSNALEPQFKWLPGFEDLRLFSVKGRVHAASSVCARTHDGRFRAVMAILDLDEHLTTIQSAHYQESRFAEKNWMPFVQGDIVRFVYQTEPHTIVLRWDEAAHRVTPEPPGATGMIRGGSQLLPLPDGRFLACVHENRAPAGHSVGRYAHRFVLFDKFLQLERKSEMFVFKETGIEFCAGMALWKGKLVLSFGLQDKEAWIAVMNLPDALESVGFFNRSMPDDVETAPELPVVPDEPDTAVEVPHHHAGDDSIAPPAPTPEPSERQPVQYDLEPQKRPVAPDEKKLAAEATKTIAEFRPQTARAPATHTGPSDDAFFTKIIPELPGWCSIDKSRRLADLVEARHARSVVEIGVFGGRSLLALGVGARRVGATVTGFDPYTQSASLEGGQEPVHEEWWKDRSAGGSVDYEATYKVAQEACMRLVGVGVVRAKSLAAVDSYRPGTVDVIHIDGNHSEETSCADVKAWLPKLSLGAIIIMDDVGWETTMKSQKLLEASGCMELERVVQKTPDGRVAESWAVYQAFGSRLK